MIKEKLALKCPKCNYLFVRRNKPHPKTPDNVYHYKSKYVVCPNCKKRKIITAYKTVTIKFESPGE